MYNDDMETYVEKMIESIKAVNDEIHSSNFRVGVYKRSPNAKLPVKSTLNSACWDICACLDKNVAIKTFNSRNQLFEYPPEINCDGELEFTLYAGERALIPAGLILDIPAGYSVRAHPRSGLSIKNGITLINCEGVIDEDYTQEFFITLVNTTNVSFKVEQNMRLAQIELYRDLRNVDFVSIEQSPEQKTDRNGGFGSTGVKS